MRKTVLALAASVSLLFGGLAVGSTAQAAPVAPSVTASASLPVPVGLSGPASKAGAHALKGKPPAVLEARSFVSCGTPPTACFSYAGKRQTGISPNADGVFESDEIVKGGLLPADYHNLKEITVQTSDGQQVVEVGQTQDIAVCGSIANSPCEFTFAWKNGVPLGYNGSGGFLNAVGCAPYCMGSSLAGLVGTTKNFQIQHLTSPTPGWWIAFDGAWRGAWPDSIWTASPSVTFVDGDLIQSFGELAHANTPTQSDIGTGILANSTTAGALASNYLVLTAGVPAAGTWNSTKVTTADRWTVTDVSTTSFRYGGPGGNENLPTVSPTCSGVGISPTWGGYGSMCPYGNTSGGVPISPVHVFDQDATIARNVCHPNMGKLDGITTSPIRVWENSSYVKIGWFRDPNCLGAHIDLDYDKTVLPAGWTDLDHASFMRWSTLNSH